MNNFRNETLTKNLDFSEKIPKQQIFILSARRNSATGSRVRPRHTQRSIFTAEIASIRLQNAYLYECF